jgi:alkylhydroperoxidase family enzyme
MQTLANYPELFRRWIVFANHCLLKTSLSTRDREVVILRVGWLAECEYEWGQHVKIATDDVGFGEAEFEALAEGADASLWTPAEAALIRAADDLCVDAFVSDATWDALTTHCTEQQVLDTVFTVGNYVMLAMGLNSFGVQLDAGYPGFGPGLPMPQRHPVDTLPRMQVRRAVPRLAPLSDAACSPEQLALLTKARGHLRSVNVLDTLIRYPDLLRRWMPFFGHVLHKSSLPARDREILILRVGRLCGAEYEWAQHVPFAERAGLSAAEIRGIAEGADAPIWSETHDRLLLRAADQLHYTTMLDDTLWGALASHYDQRQMMDTIFTVGQYRLVSVALNTLCVQLDDYLTPFAA